jgi:hypothetical protein
VEVGQVSSVANGSDSTIVNIDHEVNLDPPAACTVTDDLKELFSKGE